MPRTPEQLHYGDAHEHGSVTADISLAYGWARVRVCTPDAGRSYILPDARTVRTGSDTFFLISESASETMLVKDKAGTTLATIAIQGLARVHCLDNTTLAGVWKVSTHTYGDIPAVPDPNRGYYFGNSAGSSFVNEYDPDAATWSTKTANPAGQGNPTMGWDLSDRCYVHFGNADAGKVLYEYDPDSWTAKAASDDRHGGAGVDGNDSTGKDSGSPTVGFIFGSSDEIRHNESYDRVGNSWTEQTDMTENQKAAVHCQGQAGSIFCLGGATTGTIPTTRANKYSISGNSWSGTTLLPTALSPATSSRIGVDMHILGGRVTGGTGRTDEHTSFDLTSVTYATEVVMPDAVAYNGAVDFGIVLHVGGGETDTVASGDDANYIYNGAGFATQPVMSGIAASHRDFQNGAMKAPA